MKRLVAIALVLLAGCAERDEALVNGYRFVEVSHGTGLIVRNSEIVVYPNVIEYEVCGSLIVGKRVLANDNTDYSEPFTTGLGYFAFDTRTGRLEQGLTEEAARNRR
jgi:hypothetical protein